MLGSSSFGRNSTSTALKCRKYLCADQWVGTKEVVNSSKIYKIYKFLYTLSWYTGYSLFSKILRAIFSKIKVA